MKNYMFANVLSFSKKKNVRYEIDFKGTENKKKKRELFCLSSRAQSISVLSQSCVNTFNVRNIVCV